MYSVLSTGIQETCWWTSASTAATGGRRRTSEVGAWAGFGRWRRRWNEFDVRWGQSAPSRYIVSAIFCNTIEYKESQQHQQLCSPWYLHLYLQVKYLSSTRLRYDLLCVEWDVKPYTLTHLSSTKILCCYWKACVCFRLFSHN